MKTLVYLATPYTHTDPEIQEARFMAVNIKAGELMAQGVHVFSPISHTHPIAQASELPTNWEFWKQYDFAILVHCCKVIVLCLHGWRESVGVAAEIAMAKELGIPVEYHEP